MCNMNKTLPARHAQESRFQSRWRAASSLRLLLICLLICAVLEVVVFNFGNLRTLDETGEGLLSEPAELTAASNELLLENVPADMGDVRVEIADADVSHSLVSVTLYLQDEGNSAFYELGNATMTQSAPLTQYLHFSTYGEAKSMKLQFRLADGESVKVKQVVANPNYPFVVSPFRIVLYVLATGFVLTFRKNGLRRVLVKDNEHLLNVSTAVLMAVYVVLMCSLLLLKPIYVGVATDSFNEQRYEGGKLFSTFVFSDPNNPAAGRFHVDRYYELAKSIAHGHLDLEIDPPSWLQQIDNPYDLYAREAAVQETGEEYKWDVAYYEGRYYLYFGIVPCLLLYLPMYLLTGMTFPAGIGVLIGVVGYGLGLIVLLRTLVKNFFSNISVGSFLLVSIGALSSSGLLYAILRATSYSFPMVWGLLFAVWGVWFLLKACLSLKKKYFFFSGLALALVFGCRPQLGISILFTFPALLWLYRKVKADSPSSLREILASRAVSFVLPIVVVGCLLALYNFARFGSPLDFGANYNLTTNDMTFREASPGLALQGIFFYLLQPANMAFDFPYLFAANDATSYLGVNIVEQTFGGAFATLPFLLGAVLALRRPTKCAPWSLLIAALCAMGLIVAVFDSIAAGVLGRYMVDFCPFFAAAAAIGFMVLEANRDLGCSMAMAQSLLVAAVVATLVYNFFLLLAFFGVDGGSTVGVNQFDPAMWGRLCSAFSLAG